MSQRKVEKHDLDCVVTLFLAMTDKLRNYVMKQDKLIESKNCRKTFCLFVELV